MPTVLDTFLNPALGRLGILAASETATAEDTAIALQALNSLQDKWAAEDLTIFSVTRTTWNIVSGTGVYTVGTGGTVNIGRPVAHNIQNLTFQDLSTNPDTEYPISKLTDDDFAGIVQKDLTSPFPTSWYYNPTYPLGTLTFWPVPTSSTLQGVIYALTPIVEWAALTTVVALPPGYKQMIVTNLALELTQFFPERGVPELLPGAASDAMAVVKRSNKRELDMNFEFYGGRGDGWSIYTDGRA